MALCRIASFSAHIFCFLALSSLLAEARLVRVLETENHEKTTNPHSIDGIAHPNFFYRPGGFPPTYGNRGGYSFGGGPGIGGGYRNHYGSGTGSGYGVGGGTSSSSGTGNTNNGSGNVEGGYGSSTSGSGYAKGGASSVAGSGSGTVGSDNTGSNGGYAPKGGNSGSSYGVAYEQVKEAELASEPISSEKFF
jgi:hypothetical protein